MQHLTFWRLLGILGLTACTMIAGLKVRSGNQTSGWLITMILALIAWGVGLGISFAGI